jgi:hypothetical protein
MRTYITIIAKHLFTLALSILFLAFATSKFETIVISILVLLYARLDNRTTFLAAKADHHAVSLLEGINRLRQVVKDPEYDSEGEARGIAVMWKIVNEMMIRKKIDDAYCLTILSIVAWKLFTTLF